MAAANANGSSRILIADGECELSQGLWLSSNNIMIRSPDSTLAEHAIHFWSDSEDSIVERNTIINCDRGSEHAQLSGDFDQEARSAALILERMRGEPLL